MLIALKSSFSVAEFHSAQLVAEQMLPEGGQEEVGAGQGRLLEDRPDLRRRERGGGRGGRRGERGCRRWRYTGSDFPEQSEGEAAEDDGGWR